VLTYYGVRKGDTVAIYLPMIPDLVYAMLACARIGAVHRCVVPARAWVGVRVCVVTAPLPPFSRTGCDSCCAFSTAAR
ncbi:AMP-binding protein, partial [Escherichia coli]|nr:AMP-binding protein [Escherichia coli]